MAKSKPNPGSKEAVERGCTCPVLDNAQGKGHLGDGEQFGWWMSEECPLHGAHGERASMILREMFGEN